MYIQYHSLPLRNDSIIYSTVVEDLEIYNRQFDLQKSELILYTQ